MMSPEQNELITRVGPGTTCGALMRHYWQPVALVDELPAERPVKAVRVLGQDFVLFRDERGRLRPARPRLPASRRRPRLSAASRTAACAARSTAGCSTSTASASRRRPSPRAAGCASASASAPIRSWRRAASCSPISAKASRRPSPTSTASSRPARHTFAFKGTDGLQLAAGARGRHRSGARLVPAPLLRGRGHRRRATASSSAARSADSDMPMTQGAARVRPARDPRRAHRLRHAPARRCASISDAQTHIRVTNILFPQAFVIPMNAEMTITQWHVPVDDTAATGTRSSPASARRSTRTRCARSA